MAESRENYRKIAPKPITQGSAFIETDSHDILQPNAASAGMSFIVNLPQSCESEPLEITQIDSAEKNSFDGPDCKYELISSPEPLNRKRKNSAEDLSLETIHYDADNKRQNIENVPEAINESSVVSVKEEVPEIEGGTNEGLLFQSLP